jgi:hypothetical protein
MLARMEWSIASWRHIPGEHEKTNSGPPGRRTMKPV